MNSSLVSHAANLIVGFRENSIDWFSPLGHFPKRAHGSVSRCRQLDVAHRQLRAHRGVPRNYKTFMEVKDVAGYEIGAISLELIQWPNRIVIVCIDRTACNLVAHHPVSQTCNQASHPQISYYCNSWQPLRKGRNKKKYNTQDLCVILLTLFPHSRVHEFFSPM